MICRVLTPGPWGDPRMPAQLPLSTKIIRIVLLILVRSDNWEDAWVDQVCSPAQPTDCAPIPEKPARRTV